MIKYGIIGLGNIGTAHIRNIMENELLKDSKVVAIADLKQEKIDRIVNMYKDYKFETYLSGRKLIENASVDAVIIAVPHYDHPTLAIMALKKDINVIVEKPAGVYTKQVKEMNEVALNSKGLFTMMFNQRTNCVYRKMREIIREGGIGEITRVNWIITTWFRTQNYYDSGDWRGTWSGEGGGVLFNQCPHQLDLISWIVGENPKTVRSFCHFGKWHDVEVEDDVTAYLEYSNGATGVFITTTGEYPGTNRLEISGRKGKLLVENDELVYYKLDEDLKDFIENANTGFGHPNMERIVVETDGLNLQHIGICRNFTNAILGSEELFVDGTEGINGVELMDAMLLSTWLDKPVNIPIDEDVYYEELKKRIATSRRKENVVETVLDTEGSYGSKIKK